MEPASRRTVPRYRDAVNTTRPPDEARLQDARDVALRLRAAGHEALLCGGAVRDRLLGRIPKDYDVATSARPEVGQEIFPEAVTVGAQFGVLIVPRPYGNVEVATFRADGVYVDGRRPDDVTFSDAPTDAQRRDFTVNALFEDPQSGAIHDHVDGQRDLAARLLRAIGDPVARFEEDRLRILRAVRQAVQLNFAIEPRTLDAVRRLAPTVTSVSPERIRDELRKLLRHGRGRGLRLLRDTGLLELLLPEVHAMIGCTQSPNFHPEGDVFVHTCLVVDGVQLAPAPPDETPEAEAARAAAEDDLLWSALLHDVDKVTTRTVDPDGRIRFNGHDVRGAETSEVIMDRLRFPRARQERVAKLVREHMRIAATPRMRPAKLRRFLGSPDIELHLGLHQADCGASHGATDVLEFCRTELGRYADEPVVPPPLLTGKDLIAMGYPPGPQMGEMLRWVQDEQLEGRLADREGAAREVQRRFPVPEQEAPDGTKA